MFGHSAGMYWVSGTCISFHQGCQNNQGLTSDEVLGSIVKACEGHEIMKKDQKDGGTSKRTHSLRADLHSKFDDVSSKSLP